MIVLTGATGFLGSALLAQLLARGDEVVAVKRSTSSVRKIQALLDHPGLHLIDIDIDDPAHLFERYTIDTIIHTATEYGRGAAPLYSILNANLLLPLRLAELGMQRGVRCFINTDSFFNKGGNSYSNLLNYSLSKKSLLIWLDKLAGELGIINVVLEHLYGPGDSASKFVEHVIRKVGVEQAPHIALTHGHQRRDFIFLDDVVQAYLKLVDYGRSEDLRFETFELGTGQSMQVRDFVEQIKSIASSPTMLGFGDIAYRPDEIMSSHADISRLERLGWHPTVSAADGIRRILDMYGPDAERVRHAP
ncbi:MAG: NAD-dependent epimerase/dehydratase family protein [Pseudomonadota bacterium]|nr:NAD-dependent epimerase/dehydratase family protein [Pseudomonadota bacterium]